MKKFCGNCGAQMAPEERFCGACGTKFVSNVLRPPTPGALKKKLTNTVIDKDLKNQKNTVWAYLGQLLLLGLMILVAALGRPFILLCAIPWALTLIGMIRHDIRRKKLQYRVLERACEEKKFVEDDEAPDRWQLWFKNGDGQLLVALEVTSDFYNATEIGEVFYVVFLVNDKLPALCYRISEWTR